MSQGTIGMLNDSNADHSNILPEERLHNQTLRQFYKEFCGAIKGEGMHEVNIHDVLVRLKFISPNEDHEANHGAASSEMSEPREPSSLLASTGTPKEKTLSRTSSRCSVASWT